jgi:NADH-quinone oxidoreductase subunit H
VVAFLSYLLENLPLVPLRPEAAGTVAQILTALIAAFVLITLMLLSAIFFVWLERKISARIQDRLGPTRVGGRFGWLQTLVDGIKLLSKEDIVPSSADQMLFRIGPYIALAGSYLAFLALPFGNGVVAQNMNIAVFYMLAVLSTEVYGVILGAYGSGSKWALFGGMREAAQVVSYEVPRAISVLVPVVAYGSMNLMDFAMTPPGAKWHQSAGLFWNWGLFHDPFTFLAFWTFFTCATASCKRAPFDLAEAESELVAGFHTEYSGFRWLIFFMAEYGSMFAVSGIAVLLFLGGWHIGILPFDLSDKIPILGNVINVFVFLVKGWFLVCVMMWVRWTLPRLRIDQVMMTCIKYLLPISCVLLMGVCLWQIAIMYVSLLAKINYLLFILTVAATVLMIRHAITLSSLTPDSGMPTLRWSEALQTTPVKTPATH